MSDHHQASSTVSPSRVKRFFAVSALLAAVSSTGAAQTQKPTGGSGTAFAVGKSGVLLTNAHVIEGCSEVDVSQPGQAPQLGRVAALDTRNDLALVTIQRSLNVVATFRRTPIRAGEDVIALGFPLKGLLANDLNVSKGIVSANAGLLNDTSQLQMSAAVQPGNSGGPLLDTSGALAGIVVAKLNALEIAKMNGDIPQNVNFAIKADMASAFLRAQGVEPQYTATAPGRVATADAVEGARSFTFLVECDPSRPTEKQRAEAERAAAEARAKLERDRAEREVREAQAAVARKAEAERQAAVKLDAAERDRQRFASERGEALARASNGRRVDGCLKPSTVGLLDWNAWSPLQQWQACDTAGSFRLDSSGRIDLFDPEPRGPYIFGAPSLDRLDSHALVYVYRTATWRARAVDPSVQVDGMELVRMDNQRFFSFWLAPGGRNFNAGGDNGCAINLTVERGKRYFLRLDVDTANGWKFVCFKLTPVAESDALPHMRGLKPLDRDNVRSPAVRLK